MRGEHRVRMPPGQPVPGSPAPSTYWLHAHQLLAELSLSRAQPGVYDRNLYWSLAMWMLCGWPDSYQGIDELLLLLL